MSTCAMDGSPMGQQVKRQVRLPSFRYSAKRRPVRGSQVLSWTEVIPASRYFPSMTSITRRWFLPIRRLDVYWEYPEVPMAVSLRMPVGSPFSSLTICPPFGSGVFPLISISSSCREFTHAAWAENCISMTGLCGAALSSMDLWGFGQVV